MRDGIEYTGYLACTPRGERDESARASKYEETVRIRMQHPRVDVYSFARQFSKRSSRSTERSRNYIA